MRTRFVLLILPLLLLQGCAGLIIGTAVDTTIAVAKVPFKVGSAILDVASDDD